jgi:hypothetical protein
VPVVPVVPVAPTVVPVIDEEVVACPTDPQERLDCEACQ